MAVSGTLTRDERVNASIGWVLTSVVILAAAASFLTGAFLWGGLASLVAAVVAAPALLTGDWTLVVPWPLVLVTALAVTVRASGRFPEIAGYVVIAALALVSIVELDAFTSVDMTRRFAVGFTVLTTMATQGLWAVAQFYSDRWLGTEFLRSQTELQWDFVVVTVVAIVMGSLFEWYFQRVGHAGSHMQPTARTGSR